MQSKALNSNRVRGMDIYAKIPMQQNVPAGTYTDNIVVSNIY